MFVKNHYKENAKEYVRKTREYHEKIILQINEKIFEYLSENPCVDCGESDPIVLEFDHVRAKKSHNISLLGWRLGSWASIKNEIAKCEIRCANCHRKKTAKEFGYYRFKKINGMI